MAETNSQLPGSLPGMFPETPGVATEEAQNPHDYIVDRTPFKSGGEDTTAVAAVEAPSASEEQATTTTEAVKEEQPASEAVTHAQQDDETNYGRDAAIAGGAVAAAGATGYAVHEVSKDDDEKDYKPYERAGKGETATTGELENKFATYNLNDPNPERTEEMKEKQRAIESQKASTIEPSGEHGKVEEVATAGGGLAVAGGAVAGVAAMEGEGRTSSSYRRHSATEEELAAAPKAYETAGRGTIASEAELEKRFDTYLPFNDPNPGHTQEMKDRIRAIEEEKAQLVEQHRRGSEYLEDAEATEEKREKGGLLHKILHPKKAREEKKRRESGAVSEDGGDKGTSDVSPAAAATAAPGPAPADALPASDPHEEHILIQQAGSDPQGPTLVVREHPDGV